MMRVLVVDDNRASVLGLVGLLEMDGYQAVGSTSGEEGLSRLGSEHFDVLVTDLEMPGVHGLEVIRAAKQQWPDLPVLVITAYVNSPVSRQALVLGARLVLAKPLNYETLLAELTRCAPAMAPGPG